MAVKWRPPGLLGAGIEPGFLGPGTPKGASTLTPTPTPELQPISAGKGRGAAARGAAHRRMLGATAGHAHFRAGEFGAGGGWVTGAGGGERSRKWRLVRAGLCGRGWMVLTAPR